MKYCMNLYNPKQKIRIFNSNEKLLEFLAEVQLEPDFKEHYEFEVRERGKIFNKRLVCKKKLNDFLEFMR